MAVVTRYKDAFMAALLLLLKDPLHIFRHESISQRTAVSGRHALQFAILQQHIRIMERLIGCAAAFQFILYP